MFVVYKPVPSHRWAARDWQWTWPGCFGHQAFVWLQAALDPEGRVRDRPHRLQIVTAALGGHSQRRTRRGPYSGPAALVVGGRPVLMDRYRQYRLCEWLHVMPI